MPFSSVLLSAFRAFRRVGHGVGQKLKEARHPLKIYWAVNKDTLALTFSV